MTRLRGVRSFSCIALLCLHPGAVLAQTGGDAEAAMDPPAHVSYVDGAATLERDGKPDAAPLNMPLLAGDRIRTTEGRVEILFADGSTLHLDRGSIVDFQSDDLVRLLGGRVRLAIPGVTREVSYRIDTPWASAEIGQPGEYRLSMLSGDRGDEIELAVIRGAAELVNEQGRTPLRAGERAFARGNAAPSYAYVYNSAAWDSFDRWSEARRDQRLGVSAEYLPETVRPYAASFDQYGAWQYEPSYGHVWYPRVDVGWRPYYNGRWVTLRPYGWTWVGYDPWAWPTHHYGRWGFSAGAWFWIPGRSWGPAWVSWAYAPGYVSWCPLGWNNRPVLQFNLFGRWGYDHWRAWTVVPHRHFNTGYVNVRGARPVHVDPRTRSAFAVGTRAPGYGGYAVPRASVPIRAAGTGRRSVNSPLYTNLDARDSRVGSAPSRTIVGARQPGAASAPNGARPRAQQPAGDTSGGDRSRGSSAMPAARAASQGYRAGDNTDVLPPSATSSGQRPDYARPDRAPSRMAIPRAERPNVEQSAPARTTQPVDHGVGGGAWTPRGADQAPSYGRPTHERSADPGTGQPYMGGRAVPRDRSDRPPSGYRSAPGGVGPSSPASPSPRQSHEPAARAGRPPSDAPPAGGAPAAGAAPRNSGARPSGGAPAGGQARPRGGRGGR